MKCNRRQAFSEELKNDWDKLNLAAKVLILIGILVFASSLFIAFYHNASDEIYKSIEVVFRSSLASIFGFLLSSNLKNSKDYSNNINNNDKGDLDEEGKLNRGDCGEDIEEYNLGEGNSVQLVIAFCICIICTVAILIIYILNLAHDVAAISQLRDLMCSSIGFLLGESKLRK